MVRFAGSLSELGFDVLGSPQLLPPLHRSKAADPLIIPTLNPSSPQILCWFLLRVSGQFQYPGHPPTPLGDNQILWIKCDPASTHRLIWNASPPPGLLVLRFDLISIPQLIKPADPASLLPEFQSLLAPATPNQEPPPVMQSMTGTDRDFALGFRHPPVPPACVGLWCRGRVMEYLARRVFYLPPATNESGALPGRTKLITRVRPLLLERLDQSLDLDFLARAVAMSRSHLSRSFSRETGITLRQYQQDLRMQRAAKLIAEQGMPISVAAIEVGYQSLGHFATAFKKHHGCLPSEWVRRRS